MEIRMNITHGSSGLCGLKRNLMVKHGSLMCMLSVGLLLMVFQAGMLHLHIRITFDAFLLNRTVGLGLSLHARNLEAITPFSSGNLGDRVHHGFAFAAVDLRSRRNRDVDVGRVVFGIRVFCTG